MLFSHFHRCYLIADRSSPKPTLLRSLSGGSGSVFLTGGGNSSASSGSLAPIASAIARHDSSLPSVNRPSAPISKPVASSSTPSRNRFSTPPAITLLYLHPHALLLSFPLNSPTHEAAPFESDHPHDRPPTVRDFTGRMSPIVNSALADDHLGSSHSGLHASLSVDSSRSRILQLEQQLRDSITSEERLKRQLDIAKVRAR